MGRAERETAKGEQQPDLGTTGPQGPWGRERAGGSERGCFYLCQRLRLRPESPNRRPTLLSLVNLVNLVLFLQRLKLRLYFIQKCLYSTKEGQDCTHFTSSTTSKENLTITFEEEEIYKLRASP